MIDEFLDDDFYALFNGKENIIGTNVEYLEKKIEKLKNNPLKNKDEISACYSELRKNTKGETKQKICWKFVENGYCNHCKNNNNVNGKIFSNLWHPGVEERNYLHKKNNF